MSLSIRFYALAACTLLAVPLHGCGRDPEPTTAGGLVGTYELRTVNGRAVPVDALGGALGGRIVLSRDGRATRVVQLATSGIPGPIEQRSSGTYEVSGSAVSFRLVAEGSPGGALPLQAEGGLRAGRLVFRYPSPGGGWVEEVYVRTEG